MAVLLGIAVSWKIGNTCLLSAILLLYHWQLMYLLSIGSDTADEFLIQVMVTHF